MAGKYKFKPNITLTRKGANGNGKVYNIKRMSAFTGKNFKIVFEAVVNAYLLEIMERFSNDIKQSLSQEERTMKKRYPGREQEETLRDAYSTAVEKKQPPKMVGNQITMSVLDINLMDELTPFGGRSTGKEGWWRLHESGSMRVGKTSEYGFLSAKTADYLGMNTDDGPYGKHGEGFMIRLNTVFGKKLLNAGIIKPYPGFKPKRILYRAFDHLNEEKDNIREQIIDKVINILARG